MVSREDIDHFYESTLKAQIAPLEAERRKLSFKVVAIVSFFVLLAGACAFILFGSNLVPFFRTVEPMLLTVIPTVLLLVILIVALILPRFMSRGYVARFKSVVIQGLIHRMVPTCRYFPKHHISFEIYRTSNIFTTQVSRFSGDDLVSGKIGDTPFEFSEIHAEYQTTYTDDDGKIRTEWYTIFKGLFFWAKFSKSFKGETYVLTDYGQGKKAVTKAITGFFQKLDQSRGRLIKMDNPKFEELFAVYASDSIEAHYILSQSLMERLVAYRLKTRRLVQFAFVNDKIFIAIPISYDLFEPPLFRSLLNKKLILQYFDDLELAFSIVEDLNLDTRIWGSNPV